MAIQFLLEKHLIYLWGWWICHLVNLNRLNCSLLSIMKISASLLNLNEKHKTPQNQKKRSRFAKTKKFPECAFRIIPAGKESKDMRRVIEGGVGRSREWVMWAEAAERSFLGTSKGSKERCFTEFLLWWSHSGCIWPSFHRADLQTTNANRRALAEDVCKMGRVSCRIPYRNTRTAVLCLCGACLSSFFCRVTATSNIRESDIRQEDSISHPKCLWSHRVMSQKQGCKRRGFSSIGRLNSPIYAYLACCCLDNVFYKNFTIQLEQECICSSQVEDSAPNVSGVHILIFRYPHDKCKKKKNLYPHQY